MPKPTVQNTPKPESKRPQRPVATLTPVQRWRAGPDAMEELCAHVNGGGHLAGFCKARGFPYNTVSDWIFKDAERSALYARAREERADVLADEIVAIADETEVITIIDEDTGAVELKLDATAVARNRLRVDARKWVAAKLKPKAYGERIEQVHSGSMEITQPIDQVKAELAAMLLNRG